MLTIASCARAGNKTLRLAAVDPVLWKAHYHARYIHSDLNVEPVRQATMNEDWYGLYTLRRNFDVEAVRLLDKIVKFEGKISGRHKWAEELVRRFSFDVWDVLELEAIREEPEFCLEEKYALQNEHAADGNYVSTSSRSSLGGWTRQYWARALLGAIARHRAITQWREISNGMHVDDTDRFVETFNGLSAFFNQSPQQISNRVDILFHRLLDYLHAEGVNIDKTALSYDLRELCVKICNFMNSEGFGPADDLHFHHVMNHFPHYFLHDDRRTLPISLVYVFVALARRLGINAAPVDFPARVIVHVQPDSADSEPLYVDVFERQNHILSLQNDISSRLAAAGMNFVESTHWIQPAAAAPMLLRATRNIYSSFGAQPADAPMPAITALSSASYVAMCAIGVLGPARPVIDRLVDMLERWPIDGRAVILSALGPALDHELRSLLAEKVEKQIEEEEEVASRRQVREAGVKVQYFVGQTFRHVRYNYLAFIVGWTPVCAATETWISRMRVDDLPNGRHQPFYDSIDMDGNHRYVAECNIVPESIPLKTLDDARKATPILGRYFVGIDTSPEAKRGRLVMSPELCYRYPDDEAVGAMWAATSATAPSLSHGLNDVFTPNEAPATGAF